MEFREKQKTSLSQTLQLRKTYKLLITFRCERQGRIKQGANKGLVPWIINILKTLGSPEKHFYLSKPPVVVKRVPSTNYMLESSSVRFEMPYSVLFPVPQQTNDPDEQIKFFVFILSVSWF